jgi:hypothetical protein
MLSAFTSHLDAGTPLADPPALRLPVGRCKPEPTPELREKPLMPMPFGRCDWGTRSSLVSGTARGSQ